MAHDQTTIVFAGGGTGGHLFPALAIVEWFRENQPEVGFHFLCTQKSIDSKILDQWKVPYQTQPIKPFPSGLFEILPFWKSWKKSCDQCKELFETSSPKVVVGTGGYGSGPAVHVAHRLMIPLTLFNPDVVPGKANRFLAKKVNEIYVQWAESADYFPQQSKIIATGCPVRKDFYIPKITQDWEYFGLDQNKRTLLITGASLGAKSLNEMMLNLSNLLRQATSWQILHISGQEDVTVLKNAYQQYSISAVVLPFTNQMPSAIKIANLIIARAGAVSLAEISAAGKPAILLPYPYHKDQHQRLNAQALKQRGSAIVLEDQKDGKLNAENIEPALTELLQGGDRLARMTQAACRVQTPDATKIISNRLLELADQR